MRKLVAFRVARALFCLSVAIFGASAQAYKCKFDARSSLRNADHWYSWFQSSRDCDQVLKQTFPTPKENVGAALEFLDAVRDIPYALCESPLLNKAMAQSARVQKAAEMVAAMQRVGCDHNDDRLILEGDHAAIDYLQKHAPTLLSGESGKALYSAKISLVDLETLSDLNITRARAAQDGLDFMRENFSAALVRKAFDQISDYKWSDDTRAHVRHLLRNHAEIFSRVQKTLREGEDERWLPIDAFAILAARPNHGMEAGLLQDILNSDWDINLKLNRREDPFSCDMPGRTPFLKWIEDGRFGLVRLAVSLAKPNFTPFGNNGATAYALAYQNYLQRRISEADLDFLGRYSKVSPIQPDKTACPYPATAASRGFLTLEQIARLPENEKTTENAKFTSQLKSLLLENPDSSPWINRYVFPLKNLFKPDICEDTSPEQLQTLIAQTQNAHVKLDPNSLVLCVQALISSNLVALADDAKLTLLILKLESLGYPMTGLKLDASQSLQTKVQQNLQALHGGSQLRSEGMLAKLRRANGDGASPLVQTVTLNGTSVALLADKLTDADYELLEKPELKNFAQAMLDQHGRARSVTAKDKNTAQLILSAVVAQKPDLASLKLTLETQVESSLNQTRIWYNFADVNVYDYLTNAHLQCYSATSTFEIAAALGTPDIQRVGVVIYTEGHVLPGYLTRGARGWQLTGIETTATGEATLSFGLTSAITTAMNVIEAPDFFVAEVFKNKLSAPGDYIAAVEKRMVERYGFSPVTFKKADETSAPKKTRPEPLNASLFGFGVAQMPPGDLRRTSGAKLTPNAYATGVVSAPRARAARVRPGSKDTPAAQGSTAKLVMIQLPPEVVWRRRALEMLSGQWNLDEMDLQPMANSEARFFASGLNVASPSQLDGIHNRSTLFPMDCQFDEAVRTRFTVENSSADAEGRLPKTMTVHGYSSSNHLTLLSLEVDGAFLGACVVKGGLQVKVPRR